MCRGCRLDTECESNVCDLDTGACVPASSIYYAAPDGSALASCDQHSPCDLANAIAKAKASAARNTVRLMPGDYTGSITVSGGSNVSIVGAGATILGDGVNSLVGIDISGGAHVAVRDLKVGSTLQPFSCQQASILRMDRMTTLSPAGSAFLDCRGEMHDCTHPGTVTFGEGEFLIDRCTFATLSNSGVNFGASSGATATITNSILGSVHFVQSASISVSISFSTIYGRSGVTDGGNQPLSSVKLINNIIVSTNNANSAVCSSCQFTNNVVYPQAMALMNNTIMMPNFADASVRDFHLKQGSPAIDSAIAPISDHDYAGSARPQGGAADIGAYEYTP